MVWVSAVMLSSISVSFFSIWLTLASSNSRHRNSDSYKTKLQKTGVEKDDNFSGIQQKRNSAFCFPAHLYPASPLLLVKRRKFSTSQRFATNIPSKSSTHWRPACCCQRGHTSAELHSSINLNPQVKQQHGFVILWQDRYWDVVKELQEILSKAQKIKHIDTEILIVWYLLVNTNVKRPPEISRPLVLSTGMPTVTKYFLWWFRLRKCLRPQRMWLHSKGHSRWSTVSGRGTHWRYLEMKVQTANMKGCFLMRNWNRFSNQNSWTCTVFLYVTQILQESTRRSHLVSSTLTFCRYFKIHFNIIYVHRTNSLYVRIKPSDRCKLKPSIFTTAFLTKFHKSSFSTDIRYGSTFYLLSSSQGLLGCPVFCKGDRQAKTLTEEPRESSVYDSYAGCIHLHEVRIILSANCPGILQTKCRDHIMCLVWECFWLVKVSWD